MRKKPIAPVRRHNLCVVTCLSMSIRLVPIAGLTAVRLLQFLYQILKV